MAIPNPNPVVLPPRDEQQFPHVWLKTINISAPTSASPGWFRIEFCPYNSSTGQGLWDDVSVVTSESLFQMVNEIPLAATAMNAIFEAFPHIREWVNMQQS
jgi:hypothetical protein